MNKHVTPLTPIVSPWIEELTNDRSRLYDMILQFGSPLHINSTQPLLENLLNFHNTLSKYSLRHKIFYARKPNHCFSFAQTALKHGYGIDTASLRELEECILNEEQPNLVFSAAIKVQEAIRLCIANRVTIIIDNFIELDLVDSIAHSMNLEAIVGIRLSGYRSSHNMVMHSRFGFHIDSIAEVLAKFKEKQKISVKGFHFHLNSYSSVDRAYAIGQLVESVCQARSLGFSEIDFIDIGGGFLVRYLKSADEWDTFNTNLEKAVLGEIEPITYMNNSLHLLNVNGNLARSGTLYPYFNDTPRHQHLEQILLSEYKNQRIHSLLTENNIELRIEPGRSALDQCGITVAEVMFNKIDTAGFNIIGLNMNFTQLLSSSAEFAVDPIVIYKHPLKTEAQQRDVVFVGSYCMERDVILKRLIRVKQLPMPGDLVVFINTAGYMSHFLSTNSHLFPNPKNIFIESGTSDVVVDNYNST